jgi:inhibitor of cysteine peptidase
MRKLLVIALVLAVMAGASGGAVAWATTGSQEIEKPAAIPSVSELLANPAYGTEVKIYGKVSLLGELLCPCFDLTSGDKTLSVWYDLMVEDDGAQRPPVSVEGIENGDWVIVTGELRPGDGQLPSTTFWASNIEEYGDPSDTGKVVEVAVGSLIKVALESNPTTGFEWELTEISDQTVLELVESKYRPGEGAEQDSPVVGAGGTEIWSFKALKKGEATISMEYSQPWEGGIKTAKIFDITVIIKQS